MDLITQTTAVLDVPPEPLNILANFCYNPNDPLVVRMILIVEVHYASGAVAQDATSWEYGRDLLDEAFSRPGQTVGQGDIKITYLVDQRRCDDRCECPPHQLRIELIDFRDGNTHPLFVDAGPVIGFMTESLRMVPVGQERPDVDTAIEHLLAEG